MIRRLSVIVVSLLWASNVYAQCPGSASPCETFSTFMNSTSAAGARTPSDRVPYVQGPTKYLSGQDVASTNSVQNGSYIWGGVSTGTANAQVISLSPAISSYQAGQKFNFKAGFSNTGPMTLDAGHGAVNLYQQTSIGPRPMSGGEVVANNTISVEYNGSQFVLLSAFSSVQGPAVANTSALQAACIGTTSCPTGAPIYSQGVWRTSSNLGNASPLFFAPAVGPCPQNGGAGDGASCIRAADGNSWHGMFPGNIIDALQFNVDLNNPGFNAATPINAALAYACSVSGTLRMPPGDIYSSAPLVAQPCPRTTIDGNGGKIHCNIASTADCLFVGGTLGDVVPLVTSGSNCGSPTAPNVVANDTIVYACSFPTGLQAGSYVRIFSSDVWSPGFTIGYQVKVASIVAPAGSNPGQIVLAEQFPFNLTAGNVPSFQLINMADGTEIRNLDLYGGFLGASGDQVGLYVSALSNFVVDNVFAHGFDAAGINIDYSRFGALNNSGCTDSIGFGLGYCFVVYNGTRDTSITDASCERMWDCIANGGYRDIMSGNKIDRAHCAGAIKTCFNWHDSSIDGQINHSTAIPASDSLAGNNTAVTYNAAGTLLVDGLQGAGYSSAVIYVQPTVTYPTITSATVLNSTVGCIQRTDLTHPSNTLIGIAFVNYVGGNSGLTVVDGHNHTQGCDYAHFIEAVNGSSPITSVSITGNVDDTPPNYRSIFVLQQAGGGAISNITESGNSFWIKDNFEAVYFLSTDAGHISHITAGPDTILQDSGSGGIYNRFLNVNGATIVPGHWSGGSIVAPVITSGTTGLVMNGAVNVPATVSSGFGAAPTVTTKNGWQLTDVTVNAVPSPPGVLSFPNSPLGTGWVCSAVNLNTGAYIGQTNNTLDTCTLDTTGVTIGQTIEVRAEPK